MSGDRSLTVGIMQPYFCPYIGYFQLIAAVDTFVVYDNIKYTKKGWINRNRILQGGKDAVISIPIKSDSDHLDVRERLVAEDFDRRKLLNRIAGAYARSPQFKSVMPLVERVVNCEDRNLFGYIHHSLTEIVRYLGIDTRLVVSSDLPVDHSLRAEDKVLAICEHLGAATYINAIGGQELYERETFAAKGISLKFIKSHPFVYAQFQEEFVPWLSIIDVMMFNAVEQIRERLTSGYDLI